MYISMYINSITVIDESLQLQRIRVPGTSIEIAYDM